MAVLVVHKTKGRTMSGYSHRLSELIHVSCLHSLKPLRLTTRRLIIFSQGCKFNLNLSVWLSKCCFHTEPVLVRNLFQNGYPATLIDMLKLSVRLLESFSLAIQMLLPYGTRSRTETISKRLSGHLDRYAETLSQAT